MPRVLNKRKDRIPSDAVYVGRPSIWGNPFEINRDGSRKEVIEKYKHYIKNNTKLIDKLSELKGKNLVCWCAPLACHADILLKLANKKCIGFKL